MTQFCSVLIRRAKFSIALLLGGVIALGVAAPGAHAQGISNKNITIMVPFSAGSGLDTMARLVGDELSKMWNQTVVIQNRPGASGKIGTAAVAKAAPDGHTIVFTATSYALNAVLSKELPYDPRKDFRGIMEMARATWSLAVHPSFPANSAKEFIEYVRANPGKVNFASPGTGTPHFLVMELLKLNEKLDMVHIPYSGQSQAITDVVSGQVPVMAFPTHIALPLAKANKVKMLAVFADKRVALKPDMPTMKEQGIPATIDVWYGFLAPKAVPDKIINQFNAAMNKIIQMPKVKGTLTKRSLAVTGGTPQEIDALIENQIVKWGKVVKEAKIPKR